jgi:hypothetical protein
MTCGKIPCYCNTEKVEIPFMGDAGVTNNTSEDQLASFLWEVDRVPILLALSLYTGTPRTNLAPELIPSSVTPRTACWIFENTVIVGTRGTSPTAAEGSKDIKDDKVCLLAMLNCYPLHYYPGAPRFLAIELLGVLSGA